jgi:predicted lipid-binding transport protein (Tim44 family)
MRHFVLLIALVLGILSFAVIAPPPAYAQQANQDSTSAAPRKSDAAGVPPQHANEAQMPASGETTTEAATTFSGVVVRENGELVLKDPITKVVYKLDDTTKARQFLGKRVKVTGKLQMNSNKILMESIEPFS